VSQSPTESPTDLAQFARSEFHQQLKHLDDLINHGGSLSGNERNCAFLNLGQDVRGEARFATVSHVTGVDLADDGRAWALTDWDADGDVDAWTVNRTAPRVRFLNNEQAAGNHWIALRLLGKTCNRDAIGARVEIQLANYPSAPLVRVLRAGEGFLSQSTKQLVLGLGADSRLHHVQVQWPGGTTEMFTGCAADHSYVLEQGSGVAQRQNLSSPPIQSASSLASTAASESAKREASPAGVAVYLASRLPLPPLPMETLAGQRVDALATGPGRATLVNLWATWCVPCQQELHDFATNEAAFRAQGVRVVALATDGLTDPEGQSSPAADDPVRDVAARLGQRLMIARATRETLDRLQFADDLLFAQQRPLGIPTSFLIDSRRRLVAIYRGPLELEKLRQHSAQLELEGAARYGAAVPFPGIWFRPRTQPSPLKLAARMFAADTPTEAAEFVLQQEAACARQPGFVTLTGQLASQLAQTGQHRLAIDLYRSAARVAPRNVTILNNLAWQLASRPDGSPQDRQEAVSWAQQAVALTKSQVASVLDTLATAQAASGDRAAAVQTWRRALVLARDEQAEELVQRIEHALRIAPQ